MSRESVKTSVMIALAAVTFLVAYLYMPQAIELKNQARVNESLFAEYEPSNVWTIELEGPVDPKSNLALSPEGMEKLTIRRNNRGWFIEEFSDYPAGNNKLIGTVVPVLNELKVLEVVSENPTDEELKEYGVVSPDGVNTNADEVGTRLNLLDATNTSVGELIVGKVASGAANGTYYVRSTTESGIFRVQINKQELSPSLLNWVDPNVLSIKAPEALAMPNRGVRELTSVLVSTGEQGRTSGSAYRALFDFEGSPLKRLEEWRNGQWTSTSWNRIPGENTFLQNWLGYVSAVPTVVYMADVKKKTATLAQTMEVGVLGKGMDLAELGDLGFTLKSEGDDSYLMGKLGRSRIDVLGGLRFHMVFGDIDARGLIPLVIYAEPSPDSKLSVPERESLPEESKDWDDDQKKRELDLIERRYQEARQKYESLSGALSQELSTVNQRVAPWIFFVPKEVVQEFIPTIQFLPDETVAKPETESQESGEETSEDAGANAAGKEDDAGEVEGAGE